MVSRLFSIIFAVFFFGLSNCVATPSAFAMETEQSNDEAMEENSVLNTDDNNGDSENTTEADRQEDNEDRIAEEGDENKN